MQKVKFLWSLFIAMAIVILGAFISALLVDTGEWYNSLILPDFALSGTLTSVFWSIVYVSDIVLLTNLILKNKKGGCLLFVVTAGIFNIFWCYVFFRMQAIFAGCIVLFIILLWRIIALICNIAKYDKTAIIILSLQIIWFIYLNIVNISISLLNK